MKIRSFIFSFLAVLMLMSACTSQQSIHIVKEFNEGEVGMMEIFLKNYDNEENAISFTNNSTKINVVKASAYVDDSKKAFTLLPTLTAVETPLSEDVADLSILKKVYGPMVFDESILFGSGEHLFYVALIVGNDDNYMVNSLGNITLNKGCLSVEVDIHILESTHVKKKPKSVFIVVELEGCKLKDISMADLQVAFD